jgi:hypothetical protein
MFSPASPAIDEIDARRKIWKENFSGNRFDKRCRFDWFEWLHKRFRQRTFVDVDGHLEQWFSTSGCLDPNNQIKYTLATHIVPKYYYNAGFGDPKMDASYQPVENH